MDCIFEGARAGALATFLKMSKAELASTSIELDRDGRSMVHNAVMSGNLALVKLLIESGGESKVNHADCEGWTPLHSAAKKGNVQMMRLLLTSGAGVHALTSTGVSVLGCTVGHESTQPMLLLLEWGADVDSRDNNMATVLHHAAGRGILANVHLLITMGASVDAADSEGLTPFHLAAICGAVDICILLLAKGASMEVRNQEGHTPICLAGKWAKTLEIIGEALKTCKKIRRSTSRKASVITIASELLAFEEPGEVPPQSPGNPPGAKSQWVDNCFRMAARGDFDPFMTMPEGKFRMLLNEVDSYGRSLLHHAVSGRSVKLVEKVLSQEDGKELVNRGDSECWTPLHIAANKATDMEIINILINAGSDVNLRNLAGCTPLHYASQSYKAALVKTLLDNGAKLHILDNSDGTALHRAASHGCQSVVSVLIVSGAKVHVPDFTGLTPLHLAASCSALDVCLLLMGAGADPLEVDTEGETPLGLVQSTPCRDALHAARNAMQAFKSEGQGRAVNADSKLRRVEGRKQRRRTYLAETGEASINPGMMSLYCAAQSGQLEYFKQQLDGKLKAGLPLDAVDEYGCTLLHHAALCGDISLATLLINSQGDSLVNQKNENGYTALHIAAINANTELGNMLIARGADLDAADLSGCTPLHFAASSGCADFAVMLLEAGADVTAADATLCTPLHRAVSTGNARLVANLLTKGANIDARDTLGLTPLHIAVSCGVKNIALLLVSKGADTEAVDNDGETPVSIAGDLRPAIGTVVQALCGKTVQDCELLDSGPGGSTANRTEQMFQAARYGRLDYFETMQPEDVNPLFKMRDENGRSLLHVAVESGSAALVRFMLSTGGHVHINSPDNDGWAPLHIAAHSNNQEIACLLVDSGANILATNSSECTALHYAAQSSTNVIATKLLEAGANVDAMDYIKGTALHRAASHGMPQMVSLLLLKGAQIDLQDSAGQTPLHLALSSGRKDVALLLISKGASLEAKDCDGESALDHADYSWRDELQLAAVQAQRLTEVAPDGKTVA